jgi:HSP20 family protein
MALFRFTPALDPMNALMNLQRELDHAFDDRRGLDLGLSGRGVFPAVNVFSDQDGYVVRMETPGVSSDQITIESHGRTLTISGKRESVGPQGGSFHRRERNNGQFSRSLQLPGDLELGRAEASYKNGMLTIRIPKKEEAKPHLITIKAA